MAENKDLRNLAAIIRDEKNSAQNTAMRVGSLLMLLAEKYENEGNPSGSSVSGLSVITLDALNTSPIDKAGISALMTDTTKAIQIVVDTAGVNIGILLQYSDNMRHVLTQQLYSHFTPPTGNSQMLAGHNHNRVVCLERAISHMLPLPILTAHGEAANENYLTQKLGLTAGAYHISAQYPGHYEIGYWTPWRNFAGEVTPGGGSEEIWRELLTLS